ncbi:GNAT family N-acetyltransferase [Clostridia bacterium]|nr:GNAT family N-acetyltransferase [Clostridia bacterium]
MEFFLKTDRLGLQKITFNHQDSIKSVLQDEEIMFYSASGIKNDAEVKDYIIQTMSDYQDGYGQYAAYELASGDFIGLAGYFSFIFEEHQDLEINYRLLRQYRDRGYASELAKYLAEYALTDLAYRRVFGLVDKRNLASKRVLEKAGMRALGEYNYHNRETLLYCREKEQNAI